MALSRFDKQYLKVVRMDLDHSLSICKYINNKELRKDIARGCDKLLGLIDKWERESE